MSKPGCSISVVMSVYNGSDKLEETLLSILSQEGIDFEFIVVNDGSTDDTLSILREFTVKDKRLRVIEQENKGLTCSLIRGCNEARGKYIARQDAGDISLPGRLKKELLVLEKNPEVAFVSCGTRYIGPRDEYLQEVVLTEEYVIRGLSGSDPEGIWGLCNHGSVMFRRNAYMEVGGYREEFHVAQDLDLWTRLIEKGKFYQIDEILSQTTLSPDSISGTQTAEQQQLKEFIGNATRARHAGKNENVWLEKAAAVKKPLKRELPKRLAQGNYFIGSCLRRKSPQSAKKYFKESIINDPLLWQAWVRYVECSARGMLSTN